MMAIAAVSAAAWYWRVIWDVHLGCTRSTNRYFFVAINSMWFLSLIFSQRGSNIHINVLFEVPHVNQSFSDEFSTLEAPCLKRSIFRLQFTSTTIQTTHKRRSWNLLVCIRDCGNPWRPRTLRFFQILSHFIMMMSFHPFLRCENEASVYQASS